MSLGHFLVFSATRQPHANVRFPSEKYGLTQNPEATISGESDVESFLITCPKNTIIKGA